MGGGRKREKESIHRSSSPQLATSFQETVFTVSVEAILLQCLALVRSAEDVEDDEYLDGAIQRHWLSQFEFVKVFSAMPLPAFLSWLELWDQLPALEKREQGLV